MKDLGFNYRITDFQCALGANQLKRLKHTAEKRQKIARLYSDEFCDLGNIVKLPDTSPENKKPAWHLYILRLKTGKLQSNKKKIFKDLKRKNINLQVHYIPIVMQPYYRRMGYKTKDYPVSSRYYREAISLPIFPALTKQELKYIIGKVKTVLYKYAK